MNILIQLSIVTGLLSSLCICSSVRTIALIPKGLRACMPNERGLQSFAFYGHVIGTRSRSVRTRFEGEVREPSDGLWCYQNNKLHLNIGDELVYWYRVVKFGRTTQSETISKRLQAADFLDESVFYTQRTETPPIPCHPSQGNICPYAPEIKHSDPPATDYQTASTSSSPENQMYSWLRPNNGAEIYIAQPLRPGQSVSTTAHNPSENAERSTRPLQTLNFGEGNRKICRNKGDTSVKNNTFGYSPFPPLDIAPENFSADDGLFYGNNSPKIDVRIGDSIHIDILLERKIDPCDEQLNPRKIAEIEDRIRAEFFTKLNTQNQSCENLIGLEKNFSKAVMNTLQETIIKSNSLENNLVDANTEIRYYRQIVKEILKIVDTLRDNTTNKLILQSSVHLVDYQKTLLDVLKHILEIKPESYHIIRSDIEGNKTITFELSNYGEKLQIYLAGRIKLANTRFEMFDFDLLSILQKKN